MAAALDAAAEAPWEGVLFDANDEAANAAGKDENAAGESKASAKPSSPPTSQTGQQGQSGAGSGASTAPAGTTDAPDTSAADKDYEPENDDDYGDDEDEEEENDGDQSYDDSEERPAATDQAAVSKAYSQRFTSRNWTNPNLKPEPDEVWGDQDTSKMIQHASLSRYMRQNNPPPGVVRQWNPDTETYSYAHDPTSDEPVTVDQDSAEFHHTVSRNLNSEVKSRQWVGQFTGKATDPDYEARTNQLQQLADQHEQLGDEKAKSRTVTSRLANLWNGGNS
jgi:hypothetical protein